MYVPSEEEFHRLAGRGNIIPVYREVLADMDTPVSAFLKIQEDPYSFLLESVEGGEEVGALLLFGKPARDRLREQRERSADS